MEKPKKKSRSVSRRRKPREAGAGSDGDPFRPFRPQAKGATKETNANTVATPWISTTPQTRMMARGGDGLENDLPPQPVPGSEQAAMQVRECLRKAGVAETVIKEAISALSADTPGTEPLDAKQAHKHLQVFKKAEKKVQVLKDGIGEMEQAWTSFVDQIRERFEEQQRCFMEKRAHMIEELQQARERRDAARTQLRQLSEQLAEEGSEPDQATPDVDTGLEHFFSSMAYPIPAEVPDSPDQTPMEEELVKDSKPGKTSPGTAKRAVRPFAARKVQPLHLKKKDGEDKADA